MTVAQSERAGESLGSARGRSGNAGTVTGLSSPHPPAGSEGFGPRASIDLRSGATRALTVTPVPGMDARHP
jgi:hypothetical protein